MVDFVVTVEIDRPAPEVFAYISNFEHNPIWQGGMKSATFTSDPPLGVGSTYVQVASFMGKRIDTKFEVTAFETDRSVSIASTGGTFPIQVTRSVESLSELRTKVSAHIRGQPKGFMKLMGPLLEPMVQKNVEKDYANLKQILES